MIWITQVKRGPCDNTCQIYLRNQFSVSSEHLLESTTRSIVRIKAEDIPIVRCSCNRVRKTNLNGQQVGLSSPLSKRLSAAASEYYWPSPNPKQGIRLSSSKDESVLPMIDIACSYGFWLSPRWWRHLRWKDRDPVHSLLLVKSMPTMRFEDSRPASARAAVTCYIFTEMLSDWSLIITGVDNERQVP